MMRAIGGGRPIDGATRGTEMGADPMNLRTISIWMSLLGPCLFACGGDDDDGTATDDESDDGAQAGADIDPAVVTADVATVLCEASAPCECATGPSEAAACVDAISPTIAGSVAAGDAAGLRFYEECMAAATAYADAFSCRTESEVAGDAELADLQWEAQRCKLLAGTDELGDPCFNVGEVNFLSLGDTCAQGLRCAEVCIKLIEEVGQPCAFGTCAPGTQCLDPDADGIATCQPRPGEGEPCNPHSFDCDGVLVCDPMALVCGAPPGPGETCREGRCEAGSICVNTVCEPLGGEGEPCGGFGCGDGLRCDLSTATCVPRAAEGEGCFLVEDCVSGLACDPVTATCVAPPGEGEPCASGVCAADLECSFDGNCVVPPPVTCQLPYCLYEFDGLCDEPEGTGLCIEGSDVVDCQVVVPPEG
jgi:hypothetical protein